MNLKRKNEEKIPEFNQKVKIVEARNLTVICSCGLENKTISVSEELWQWRSKNNAITFNERVKHIYICPSCKHLNAHFQNFRFLILDF